MKYIPLFFTLLILPLSIPLLGREPESVALSPGALTDLSLRLEYAVDPTGKLQPEEVSKRPFRKNDRHVLNLGFTPATVWMRLRVRKEQTDMNHYLLVLPLTNIKVARIYFEKDGGFNTGGASGTSIPLYSQPYPARVSVFPIQFDSRGNASILLSVRSDNSIVVPVHIFTQETFSEEEATSRFAYGLYFGIVFAMIIYNLLLFLSLRDRMYLYYVLFIFSIAVIVAGEIGYMHYFLLPGHPVLENRFNVIAVSIGAIAGLIFAQKFLITSSLNAAYPILYRFLISLYGGNLAYGLLDPNPSMALSMILSIPNGILNLTAASHAWSRGLRTARLFLLAFSIFLFGLMLRTLLVFQILPTNFVTLNSYKIGSVAEMMLLSLALADRINLLREEREEARIALVHTLERTREELERLVEERTADLRQKNQDLNRSLEEKEVLLREVHHRVKNNMQIMLGFLWRGSRSVRSKRVESVLGQARDRIKTIAMIHSRFYKTKNLASIDFSRFVEELARDLLDAYGSIDCDLRFKLEPVELDLDRAMACGMIANELITNAMKYSLCAGKNGSLSIELATENGETRFIVEDSGPGFSRAEISGGSNSFGLSLSRDLVERKLSGRFWIENRKGLSGARAGFSFPLALNSGDSTRPFRSQWPVQISQVDR